MTRGRHPEDDERFKNLDDIRDLFESLAWFALSAIVILLFGLGVICNG